MRDGLEELRASHEVQVAASVAVRATPSPARPPAGVKFNRIAYSAAHVVADPLADVDPWLDGAIDWERTIAFFRRLPPDRLASRPQPKAAFVA